MNHDYELERQGHPENFCTHPIESAEADKHEEVWCAECGSYLGHAVDVLPDPWMEPHDQYVETMIVDRMAEMEADRGEF